MKNKSIIYVFFSVLACIIISCKCNNSKTIGKDSGSSELRVLAWVGYEERDLIDPFEKEFGVKVKTEIFTTYQNSCLYSS